MLNVSSSSIYAAVENVHPILLRRLKKLILDGRVWGSISAEHLKCLQEYMPACDFDAELAPDDCKDLKVCCYLLFGLGLEFFCLA